MKVFVKGLNSCGMRKTDVQRYKDFLEVNGHVLTSDPVASDVVLLWTCAFREDQRENALSEIKRYQKDYKAEIIVAGCLPDIDRDAMRKTFNGRFVNWRDDESKMEEFFGAPNKRLAEIPRLLGQEFLCDDVEKFRRENPDKDASFIDHFNKLFVAEGCRFECTYCAEILAFPPYRSFPEDEIVEECRRLIARTGKKQVILLGDSIGDYGSDIGGSLPRLMRKLKALEPSLVIAVQGLNPIHFLKYYDEFLDFIRQGDIRHLQIPIQSASERILGLMKRPYNKADIEKVYGTLNQLGFREFDSHIILGFPSETDDDFEETIEFILRQRPKYVLASGFMASPRMPAYLLPHPVDLNIKRRRMREAEMRIKAAGIICNTDFSELTAERCRRLNTISCSGEKANRERGHYR